MALAWGLATPRATATVEFQGATHAVDATDQGWWMFVMPSSSGDEPTVAGAVAGD